MSFEASETSPESRFANGAQAHRSSDLIGQIERPSDHVVAHNLSASL